MNPDQQSNEFFSKSNMNSPELAPEQSSQLPPAATNESISQKRAKMLLIIALIMMIVVAIIIGAALFVNKSLRELDKKFVDIEDSTSSELPINQGETKERTARDKKRHSMLSQYAQAIATYQSNNNGRTIFYGKSSGDSFDIDSTFFKRYIASSKVDIDKSYVDPDGEIPSIVYVGSTNDTEKKDVFPESLENPDYTIYATTGASCGNDEFIIPDDNELSFVLLYYSDDGVILCVDNA